jgi:NAD(P)-dependent dehydrogenase (short-subunit alcohol dehydrogenase family)
VNGIIESGTVPVLVVVGATGTIGRGVVAAAVAAGRPVVAVARSADGLQALRAAHPGADLSLVAASLSSDGDAAALADRLRASGRVVCGVIAAVCGAPMRGRVLEEPADFLRRKLDDDLLPHLFAARHLLPLLAADPRGGYVLVGGPGGEHPWAGYGHGSIAAAALRMLARVLHDEARALDVRVHLLSVDSPAATDANRGHACPQWPAAEAIGRRALALVERGGGPPPEPAVVRFAPAQHRRNGESHVVQPHEASTVREPLPPDCVQDARRLLHSVLPAPARASATPRRVFPALPPPASGHSP